MAARSEQVVTLDGRTHSADVPLVSADDPLFARGDGVFETLLLRRGVACLLREHLARLSESAAVTELPAPDLAAFESAAEIAATAWGDDEGVLRMVHGRGAASFVTVSPIPARVAAARRDGVSAVTLVRRTGEWSPVRAKSSSYAVNLAALQEAERRGADDAIFVDSNGVVLEGPRSSVVAVLDGELRTPPSDLPILPGTTVAALFREASAQGIPCRETLLMGSDLSAAQEVWLLSAVTLAARVTTLDGVRLASSAVVDIPELLDAALV